MPRRGARCVTLGHGPDLRGRGPHALAGARCRRPGALGPAADDAGSRASSWSRRPRPPAAHPSMPTICDAGSSASRPCDSTMSAPRRPAWRAAWRHSGCPAYPLLYVGRSDKSQPGRSRRGAVRDRARPPSPASRRTLAEDAARRARLHVWWAETDAAEEYEDEVLAAFAEAVPDELRERLPSPTLPWANLESPSGVVRDTGLVAELRDDEPSRAAPRTCVVPTRRAASRDAAAIRVVRRPRSSVVRLHARRQGSAREEAEPPQ